LNDLAGVGHIVVKTLFVFWCITALFVDAGDDAKRVNINILHIFVNFDSRLMISKLFYRAMHRHGIAVVSRPSVTLSYLPWSYKLGFYFEINYTDN